MNTFTVREVEECDLPALHALEMRVWKSLGTAVLGPGELRKWFDTGSPFFLVAEKDGEIAGYYYGQVLDFSLDSIEKYTNDHNLSGTGYTVHVHDPNGNSVNGLCVVSPVKGAGKALNREVYARVHRFKKDFYFGYSRLSGFDRYLEGLSADELARCTLYHEHEVALWYAHECISLVNGKIWQGICTPKPALDLPSLQVPDPVLSFHAKGTEFGLLRVVADYMPDPESRNYGAFLAYDAR